MPTPIWRQLLPPSAEEKRPPGSAVARNRVPSTARIDRIDAHPPSGAAAPGADSNGANRNTSASATRNRTRIQDHLQLNDMR